MRKRFTDILLRLPIEVPFRFCFTTFPSSRAWLLAPRWWGNIEAAILAIACVLPELPLQLMKDFKAGVDIGSQQFQLARVARCVTDDHGIPGLKYAMDLLGFEGGQSRLPLLPLDQGQKVDIERAFEPFLVEMSGVST